MLLVAAVAVLIVGFVYASQSKLTKALVPNFVPDVKAFRAEQKRMEEERIAAKRAARENHAIDTSEETDTEQQGEQDHGDDH